MERTIKRLEFDKVLEQLAACAQSEPAREKIKDLVPGSDPALIKRRLAETSEGRELLRLDPLAELSGWHDIRDALARVSRYAVLAAEELLAVGETLAASRRIKKFFNEKSHRYPLLSEIAASLTQQPQLEKDILRAILPGGEIADHASPQLLQIRRGILRAQNRIRERVESIIRAPENQKYLQEPIVTVRQDRYVIPVKQEYRNQIPGIVHDQSASGATLFVEPLAVVDANNEVRRLMAAEKQEIQRILAELSQGVSAVAQELSLALQALAELDYIMARARYSLKLKAWSPQITEGSPYIYIKQGRHPLLPGDAVPATIELGKNFKTLVITGPNTGGKTVTLKTVGLFALMTQAGLHIPAEAGTTMGVYKKIFADIGDEQSIEQSLSTFSSHMTNIVHILQQVDEDSLVLLDELGAGTDPTEGAALARAILEELHNRGACTIATTHYSELKNYAYTTPGVENASVEFDAETLRPTYRLLIGRPGRSNAFEISARLGLRPDIVNRARQFLTTEQVQVAELINKLEKTQQAAEKDRAAAAALRRESEQLQEEYRRLAEELRTKKEEILARAHEEAGSFVRRARLEAEEAVKELRARLAEENTKNREEAIQQARSKLQQVTNKVTTGAPQPAAAGEVPDQVKPGEEVFLPKYNQKAYVLSVSGENVQVQAGILKMVVPVQELRRVNTPRVTTGESKVGKVLTDKALTVSTSLDLRGMTGDEAWPEIEKYLDDAFLAGLNSVILIHGKGTGALRAAVHRELKSHPRVKSFRLGEAGEGGAGATVVYLK
ncbi:endonuclease MutS2 [Desulforamulus hydrothermalis]|uniref:Endonuclease MutS2 n=1 Tax=Desulforamulus hydrothermalis Lam5 = DSM 18033 TaxID=1121428 RepID=K8DXC7_9FIRM|nr:endonuclease MutS2 [Desulforamulus hydrothermalis]CCO07257.1 MutS2 protein [Desulforamulus hydrothermalis Lam5 = DSM 18033]SHG92463.1 DNA mismatch repair protein, MutS family [Desulforamulus hydrothermalis Lam5 = DSM 18033]